ncbi:MAG: hypothetical protein IKM19_05805 [Firmicutes bacterium]|nr:hypothetical protein [Bacillota bacterium]MBR3706463.1 hypothetical protein [Bacillota bacterium]MBR6585527.1 hypothetical protein [Bacillota bacterium]
MVTNTAIPANPLEEAARITEEMILKGVLPGLGVLRVGAEPDHVALEEELVSKARTMGIVIEKYIMNAKSEESDVIDVIEVLNTDYKLHAVVMPGPLPAHMDEANVRGFLGDAGKAVSGEADELLYHAAVKAQKWAESYEE